MGDIAKTLFGSSPFPFLFTYFLVEKPDGCALANALLFRVRGGKVGASLIEVADHIDHIRDVCNGSCDHIGIGADYDGIKDTARGLEDVSMVPHLTAELLRRGYSEENLGKILGLNAIRVLEVCESVAASLAAEGAIASDKKIRDIEPLREEPADVTGALAAESGVSRKRPFDETERN